MQPRNFGLKEIDVFVKVVDLGSFVKAARELRVTQSALTQRLKKLEEALGARLIDRTTRTVAPTAVGRSFLPAARRLIEQFEQSVADVEGVIGMRGGRVAIASLITVATHILPAVLGRFSERHPGVRVRIFDESEQDILEYVRRGDAEFAIDMLVDTPDPELVFTTVMHDRFVLACHRDHALARGGPVPWSALADMPVVTLGQRSGTSRLLLAQLPSGRDNIAWRYEVQHLSTKMAFIETGLGVGVVPEMAMRTRSSDSLTYRPLVEPDLARRIAIVERRDATLSPAAAALKEALVGAFDAHAAGTKHIDTAHEIGVEITRA
ncbi:MAG: LysR substrate-binding domain-containing protein [Pseudomonadota bacterium]